MKSWLNSKTTRDLGIIVLTTLALTFLVWLPHFLALSSFYNLDFSSGFNTIFKNFDGLEYVVIAKSLYDPKIISSLPHTLFPSYYAAHFPGFAIMILLFAPLLGFLKSMLFVSILFTIASTITFYFLIRNFKLTSNPLLLSLISLVLPARWLVVHSVGSAEPMFIFFCLLTIYSVMKYEATKAWSWIWIGALSGLLAQITRSPGILLFISLMLYVHWKYFIDQKFKNFSQNIKEHLKFAPFVLIPLGILGVFLLYQAALGDFLAYFHSGDNIHISFPPFQVFDKHWVWVGEIWLEDIIYIYILGLLGGLMLWRQKLRLMSFFVLTYLAATMLVVHRDIARYSLPIFPFLLIAFEKVLVSKEFKIILVIVLLAIYLYAQNFLIENTSPIPNVSFFN